MLEPPALSHAVQFYESDAFLIETVAWIEEHCNCEAPAFGAASGA